MSIDERKLADVLADAIKVPREDFSKYHLETLIAIGKGMFWSAELDNKAKGLKNEVDAELEIWMRNEH